jgi:hypothetical protein
MMRVEEGSINPIGFGLTDIEDQVRHLLQKNGYLLSGQSLSLVAADDQNENQAHIRLYFLEVITDAPQVPRRMVLKSGRRNTREVAFYCWAMFKQLPIAPCLAAQIDPNNGETLLLFADLSTTHTTLANKSSPCTSYEIRRVVEALACIQANGWERRQAGNLLVDLPGIYQSVEEHQAFLGWLERDVNSYLRAIEDRHLPLQADLYHQAIMLLQKGWDQTWKPRLATYRHLALVHGDLHPGNVFYPNQQASEVCFIDWEAYRIDLPTTDLAMLLALHLAPDAKDALPLLEAYHAALVKYGVNNYPFEQCLADYHAAILYGMFYPMRLFSQFHVHDEAMIHNSLIACQSFDCLDLI